MHGLEGNFSYKKESHRGEGGISCCRYIILRGSYNILNACAGIEGSSAAREMARCNCFDVGTGGWMR